jgi:TolA protein
MFVKSEFPTPLSFKKPIIYSIIGHIIVLTAISLSPTVRLPMHERPARIVWVELPKGTSDEIGLGIKKSPGLPKTTLEEQKKMPAPEQKALAPELKVKTAAKEPEKMTMPVPGKPPQPAAPKPRSATDRKIADALAKIDKDLAQRTAAPEAAQINAGSEGYKYGTGNQPLKVLPSDPEYLKYQAMVRARIISHWVLPLRYIEEGGERRRCSVEVMINLDGDVISTRWAQSSGDPTFDASAMRAVRNAAPFPKPPDRLAWEAYNEGFLVEFDPRLKPQ